MLKITLAVLYYSVRNYICKKLYLQKIKLLSLIGLVMLLGCSTEDTPKGTEEEQIEAFIAKKNLTITEKTPSGLRFIRKQVNASGSELKKGQNVTVKYEGRLLNDKKFDAGEFSFILGIGQVVPGFDEGIAKLKMGEKGTLIFPSSLGYGSRGAGNDIPPFAPLLFEIEVIR
jgi:FKBP-type peptidyl-prolyl cis-trans isomerase